jgi:hypothetical protein
MAHQSYRNISEYDIGFCQKIGDQTPQNHRSPHENGPINTILSHHISLIRPANSHQISMPGISNWSKPTGHFSKTKNHGFGDEHPSLHLLHLPHSSGTVFQIPNISGMSFTSFAFAKARTMPNFPNFPSATAKSLGVQQKGNGRGPKAYSSVIDMS